MDSPNPNPNPNPSEWFLSLLQNVLLLYTILNRTPIVLPVLDHHSVALGSCPKFRVAAPSELRAAVWDLHPDHTFSKPAAGNARSEEPQASRGWMRRPTSPTRKGFVRIAIKTRRPIVPVFCFGQKFGYKWRKLTKKGLIEYGKIKFSTAIYWGRFGHVGSSGGLGSETTGNMMQKFWDTAMAIGPLDDDDDTRSEGSLEIASETTEAGRSSFSPSSGLITTFGFKIQDGKGRMHRFSCDTQLERSYNLHPPKGR